MAGINAGAVGLVVVTRCGGHGLRFGAADVADELIGREDGRELRHQVEGGVDGDAKEGEVGIAQPAWSRSGVMESMAPMARAVCAPSLRRFSRRWNR